MSSWSWELRWLPRTRSCRPRMSTSNKGAKYAKSIQKYTMEQKILEQHLHAGQFWPLHEKSWCFVLSDQFAPLPLLYLQCHPVAISYRAMLCGDMSRISRCIKHRVLRTGENVSFDLEKQTASPGERRVVCSLHRPTMMGHLVLIGLSSWATAPSTYFGVTFRRNVGVCGSPNVPRWCQLQSYI